MSQPRCPNCGNTRRWDSLIIDDDSSRGTCGECGTYLDIPHAGAGGGSFSVSNLDVRGPATFGSGNTMNTYREPGPAYSAPVDGSGDRWRTTGEAQPLTDLASFERHDPAAEALHWRDAREEYDRQGRVWMVNPDTGARIRADGQLMDDGTVRYPDGDVQPARNWPPQPSPPQPSPPQPSPPQPSPLQPSQSSPAPGTAPPRPARPAPPPVAVGPQPLTDVDSFERHNPAAEALYWARTHEEEDDQGRLWMTNRDTGARVRVDGQVMDDGTVRYPNGDVEPARNWPPEPNPPAAASGPKPLNDVRAFDEHHPAAPAVFWRHTRQETDADGRRWLVDRETGARVRLDGQLMDDGTVHYPNGDVEPARNWNRVTPPATERPPASRRSAAGQEQVAGSRAAGPWSSPPSPGSPGVPGEITGLVSAQQYAQGMSAALGSHGVVIEQFVAVLIAADVSGDAVTCAVHAQELTLRATQAWVAADAALNRQHGVREAYGAVPEAGDKQWVQAD